MASSSKPFSTVGKCETATARNPRKNGGILEKGPEASTRLPPTWRMLKIPAPPPSPVPVLEGSSRPSPPPRHPTSNSSGGYQVADAAYQTISSMLDETNELKAELKRCQATNARQTLELEVKNLEIEGLRRRLSQLEETQFQKTLEGIAGGSMKVLDDKLKYFELKVEEAEKEIERMKKQLLEESVKKRDIKDLLKDLYQAVIDMRLEAGKILKKENSKSLEWLIDHNLEHRMSLLVKQLEAAEEEPDFQFRPCHSQVMEELKALKLIHSKLAQLIKPPDQRVVSNLNTPIPEPDVIEIVDEITPPRPPSRSPPKSPLKFEFSAPAVITVPPRSPVYRPVSAPGPRRMPNPSRVSFKKAVHKVDEVLQSQGFFCACGLQFRSKEHLNHHIKYFSCEKRFPCKFGCGKSFVGASILKKHLQVKHGVQIRGTMIGCRDCGACFASRLELTKHRQQHHSIDEGTHEEPAQGLTPSPSPSPPTPAEPLLLEHVSTCPPIPQAAAPVPLSQEAPKDAPPIPEPSATTTEAADPSSGFAEELIQMAGPTDTIHHAADNDKRHLGAYCTCGQLCANRRALHHHLWYRNYKNRLMCNVCHRTYPGYSYLNRHMYGAHRLIPAHSSGDRQMGSNPNTFVALQSRKTERIPPRRMSSLESPRLGVDPSKTHISTNHMISPSSSLHGCQDCGLVFGSVWELLEHRRVTHDNGPPPSTSKDENAKAENHGVVEVIDLEPSSLSNIKQEKPSSSVGSVTPFYCKCGKGFLLKKSLLLHIQAQGELKIFQCEWCPSGFADHSELKSHIGKTHPHVVYTMNFGCNQCGGTFATRNQLFLHCRISHRRSTSSSSS